MVSPSMQLITDMDTPQYSLRWNNHLVHMMDAIEVLLQNETLVDVTLVCENTQFKAHKVVLSACRYVHQLKANVDLYSEKVRVFEN